MVDDATRRFALVAGEPSGDLLAGLLLDGLRTRWPQALTQGIGGPQMLARGFESWWPQEKLAVRGYIEVLRHYAEIAGIRRQLKARLLREWPEIFIGVDAPDFNLDLESALRGRGMKTVHFVCPSIWAWRPDRIEKIRAAADHVLCIFPFEPALLEEQGVEATYVGHPLAIGITLAPDRGAARRALGLPADTPVVALLPGSRRSEVRALTARFFAAAALMRRQLPGVRFVMPVVAGLREEVEALLAASEVAGGDVLMTDGRSHDALAACDVTLIASGTATLEAALFKRPMVIAYNMNRVSWHLMHRQQLQPWVGLPNILCRDFVVPELLQEAATPEALAEATLRWLRSPDEVEALQRRFAALHAELQRDTSTLCADAIQNVLAS
jgi:lipid-A-disaccharide synthase